MKTIGHDIFIFSITILAIMLFTFNEGQAFNEFLIATNPDTATYLDQQTSISAAFDGINYLVAIQDASKSTSNPYDNTPSITAQLISQSGTLVGGRILTGSTGGAPFIAFDGTNYLMVWGEDRLHSTHIYGRFISKAGMLVGPQITVGIGSNTSLSLNPILFDGTNYFVVWDDYSTSGEGETSDVYGQFITPSGTLLGEAIPVSTGAYGKRMPTLSFDGTNILVVWVDGRNQSACYTDAGGTHCFHSDVYGQFVTKSSVGTPGGLSGSNFLINASSVPRNNPITIAFDGTNYFVAFEEETTLPNACPPSGCKWHIYGQLVTKAGTPIGSKIAISDTSPDNHWPVPVFDGTNYLVTWTEGFGSTEATVKGKFFNKSGDPASSEFTLFMPSEDKVPWLAVPIFDGLKYFLVVNKGTAGTDPSNTGTYTSQDVYGAFILLSGVGSPVISVSPMSVNFGNVKLGGSSGTKTITIKNAGTSGLTISSITITGTNASEFTQTNNCTTIPPKVKTSCTITVTLQPTSTGSKIATLSISSNDPKNPKVNVKLSGNAVCTYSISPTSQEFDAPGGPGNVSITTEDACPWEVTSHARWITITSSSSSNGNGTVYYSVAPNTSTSQRTGRMTIAEQTFTVTQKPKPSGSVCKYSISPTSQSFDFCGGIDSVFVTASDGCPWTAASNASWILITSVTITSGSSGSVNYSVAPNPNDRDRTGTITIAGAGLTFTVMQAACPTPGTPSDPTPSDGDTDVSPSTKLSWAPTTDTQSYNVYFGESSNPPFLVNTTANKYYPTGLITGKTYYWRVEALNSGCTANNPLVTKGPLWSFTTTALSVDITDINCTSDSEGNSSFTIAGTACGPEGTELASGPCCPGQTGIVVDSCPDWQFDPLNGVCLREKGEQRCTDWTGSGQNGPPPITICIGVWYPGTTPATCISDTVIIGDCPVDPHATAGSAGASHAFPIIRNSRSK